MPLAPGYGETPLPEDELVALLPRVVDLLGKPIRRADLYDLEQAVQQEVSADLLTAAFDGSLQLDDLLSEYFLRDLHARLYADIWVWAGRWRRHEVNIGVAPERVGVELRNVFGNIRYRWGDVDKDRYIHLLRDFDAHRDVRELAAFIDVQSIEA